MGGPDPPGFATLGAQSNVLVGFGELQDRPKSVPRGPKTAPRGSKIGPRGFKKASRPAKMTIFVRKCDFAKIIEKPKENQCFWLPQATPNRHKMAPSPAKMAQDDPRTLQDGPKTSQDHPKTVPRSPQEPPVERLPPVVRVELCCVVLSANRSGWGTLKKAPKCRSACMCVCVFQSRVKMRV